MKTSSYLRVLVVMSCACPAFGQAPSTPLPAPKFSQTSLPPGARSARDASGRMIVGTDAQRMHLLDPQFGALAAASHNPALVTPEQQKARVAAWAKLSASEKKARLAQLSDKIQQAHSAYLNAHAESMSTRQRKVGTVDVPLHGVKLHFKVDARENDAPLSFRDSHGNRILRAPAQPKLSTASAAATPPTGKQSPVMDFADLKPGAWHRMDAVMRKNPQTGEHLAFLRTSAQTQTADPSQASQASPASQINPGRICPIWGCNPRPRPCAYVVSAPTSANAIASPNVGCPAVGPDADGDGIPDYLESQLAASFTPTYHVSNYEQPGTGFATMQDAVPENVQTTYGPTPPISYYRVEPSTFIDSSQDASGNTVYHRYLRIDYLTLWNQDDGLAHGLTCDLAVGGTLGAAFNFVSGIVGFDVAAASASLGGHYLDDEHSAVLVAVEVNGPTDTAIPADYTQYSAVRYFNAAHEHTAFDASEYATPAAPVPSNTHIDLYLSQSKHSTYFFNPDRKPIVISRDDLNIIEATLVPMAAISISWDYYDQCPVDTSYFVVLPDGEILFVIDNGDGSCYIPDVYVDYAALAEYEALTEEVFADCLGEHFTDLGPTFSQTTINVGEPNNPTAGNHFIQDTTPDLAGAKLTEPIFPDKSL